MNNCWLKIKKPIIGLAPMDGITDFPMREIQAQIAKPDIIYTEFISIEGFIRAKSKFLPKLALTSIERPLIAQFFGKDPRIFKEAVNEISKLDIDGVDINMGCPSRRVLDSGGGGALIGNYGLSEKIIIGCLEALKGKHPLSIKTRIRENEKDTLAWLQFLASFPLAAIAVHGRTLKQLHSGPVFWSQISKCSELVRSKKIIFIGNGGVQNRLDGIQISNKYNLDGVLIGQASLGNPWVFKENCKPAQKEIFQTIIKHAQLAQKFYGEKNFKIARKHFGWYCRGFENSKKLRIKLFTANSSQEVEKIIREFQSS